MPTSTLDPTTIPALIAAYKRLELERDASKLAIRYRYRELARIHHPDKHAAGSAAQIDASRRMADINRAYDLIHDAPLKHYEPADVTYTIDEITQRDDGFRFDRVVWEALARMAFGALFGLSLAWLMPSYGMNSAWPHWVLPPIFAFLYASRSPSAASLLRALWWV